MSDIKTVYEGVAELSNVATEELAALGNAGRIRQRGQTNLQVLHARYTFDGTESTDTLIAIGVIPAKAKVLWGSVKIISSVATGLLEGELGLEANAAFDDVETGYITVGTAVGGVHALTFSAPVFSNEAADEACPLVLKLDALAASGNIVEFEIPYESLT